MPDLHELFPSIAAQLGVAGQRDTLGLPRAERYVVVLIDGLGELQLAEHADVAPFLSSLTAVEGVLAGLPTTTAASLTAVSTGLPTGQHGMVGYTARIPETDRLLNALVWDEHVDPEQWQPRDTLLQLIARAGHRVTVVNQADFADSGLTRATQRGVPYVGVKDPWSRRDAVVEALERTESGLVYTYESRLDRAGHKHGVASRKWLRTLSSIDAQVRELHAMLPDGTTMIVTPDHGMINLPRFNRFEVDREKVLLEGVELIGGEARFRHVYTEPGRAAEVAARWGSFLGERADVRLLSEAEEWFGPIDPTVRARFGDVIMAARGDFALFSTQYFAVELVMKGFHGSTSDAERKVPVRHG